MTSKSVSIPTTISGSFSDSMDSAVEMISVSVSASEAWHHGESVSSLVLLLPLAKECCSSSGGWHDIME